MSRLSNSIQSIVPAIEFPVTICVLFYGDYPTLCRQFFDTLEAYTDSTLYQLRIGLNEVGESTRQIVSAYTSNSPGTLVFEEEKNIFKYPLMRRMFFESTLSTKWTIWFDDDSFIERPDWLLNLALAIELQRDAVNFGRLCFIELSRSRCQFAQKADWFQNRPFLTERPDYRPLKPGNEAIYIFATGGFWAIRSDVLNTLDWPDPRLKHNGGDSLLGEALRQNRMELGSFDDGIRISGAPRRSPANTPPSA